MEINKGAWKDTESEKFPLGDVLPEGQVSVNQKEAGKGIKGNSMCKSYLIWKMRFIKIVQKKHPM